MSEDVLQRTEKKPEVKGNGEKERYTHLNAEFQIIERRDKRILSEQCIEIEESNKMGKSSDLIEKKKMEICTV